MFAAGCASNTSTSKNINSVEWRTFSDANRHFHFAYPVSWKINTDCGPVEHYRDVFVAVNSFGKQHFMLREQLVATNTWEFGGPIMTNQLPPGSIYVDIGWWEGPWPRFGPGIKEMQRADLSTVAEDDYQIMPSLMTRKFEFFKWGRRWSIVVYRRPPVSRENDALLKHILQSFHFDGVPAGDEIWAIGEARKHLPPEADPDQFTREGGSSLYFDETEHDGQDVIVTFAKHLEEQSQQTWRFRVTKTGAVIPLN